MLDVLLLSVSFAAPVNHTAVGVSKDLFVVRPAGAVANAQTYVKTTQVGPQPEGFAEEDYDGAEGVISGSNSKLTVKGNVRAYWTKDSTKHSWSRSFKAISAVINLSRRGASAACFASRSDSRSLR